MHAKQPSYAYTPTVINWDRDLLSPEQRTFAEDVLGTPALVSDMSWGQVDTKVLHVRARDREFVVKAAGPANHHIGREIAAHESVTAGLGHLDRCAEFVAADRASNALIVTYQPGELVEGTDAEFDPDVHEQAGRTLGALHRLGGHPDDEYERRATAKSFAWLERPHLIEPEALEAARSILEAYRPAPVTVVPTHGDWQPRNWLVDRGRLRVIDFGRFDHRPAESDFLRLAAQQWRKEPELEGAFLAGYGADPRDHEVWPMDRLREAIGTAVWAYQVGDEAFEAQGHRMIVDALAQFG